jgi:hypothetical protein
MDARCGDERRVVFDNVHECVLANKLVKVMVSSQLRVFLGRNVVWFLEMVWYHDAIHAGKINREEHDRQQNDINIEIM